jgi:hypothetical protein
VTTFRSQETIAKALPKAKEKVLAEPYELPVRR